MKSVVYDSYGGFDHLRLVDEAIPTLNKATDVLIKVKAVSINGIDWKIMEGNTFLFRQLSGKKFPKHIW